MSSVEAAGRWLSHPTQVGNFTLLTHASTTELPYLNSLLAVLHHIPNTHTH